MEILSTISHCITYGFAFIVLCIVFILYAIIVILFFLIALSVAASLIALPFQLNEYLSLKTAFYKRLLLQANEREGKVQKMTLVSYE